MLENLAFLLKKKKYVLGRDYRILGITEYLATRSFERQRGAA